MLHCLNSYGNVAASSSEMTMLERQREASMKWEIPHRHHQPYLTDCNVFSSSHICADSSLGEGLTHSDTVSPAKKRKKKPLNSKSDNMDKRLKVSTEEGESKLTDHTSAKSNTETSADTSKASHLQNHKPDFIHVRARRGQATDSHSLAERVRREKISERMKYLQDLVPGCNKIAGKAGMLDEIINYVQSLQRQVEFLSMKLAAVNPRLDFNIDELLAEEVFQSCAQSFPNIGMPLPSEMSMSMCMSNNPGYLQFNSAQQFVSCCGGSINNMGISPPNMGLRRNISNSTVPLPEVLLGSSCFTQILPSSNWEGDLQSLYNVAFDQGRTGSFPSQPFTGLVEASNLKMEM